MKTTKYDWILELITYTTTPEMNKLRESDNKLYRQMAITKFRYQYKNFSDLFNTIVKDPLNFKSYKFSN